MPGPPPFPMCREAAYTQGGRGRITQKDHFGNRTGTILSSMAPVLWVNHRQAAPSEGYYWQVAG
jgi:hypothetical protein